eukprot:2535169-Pyramimonas_sp.AAC.1
MSRNRPTCRYNRPMGSFTDSLTPPRPPPPAHRRYRTSRTLPIKTIKPPFGSNRVDAPVATRRHLDSP